MTPYESFIHLSRYSRFIDEENRRETWSETVDRLVGFWKSRISNNIIADEEFQTVHTAILNREVMPSMRAMWSAGQALEGNHFRGYNCSFAAVDHIRVFDEILFILMAGTGVGFSAEAQYVNKLPIINDTFNMSNRVLSIEDSAEGWAKGLRKLIAELYLGNEHDWDFSKIRPEGARLKTMGGRASGPAPLVELFKFVTEVFKKAAGRKLTPQEVHDIVCKIAEVVVVGGVRRSALISLSDLGDPEIRDCKSGRWWETAAHRALANNSAVYDSKPSMAVFMDEWNALMKSGSGERGIYNRGGARTMAPKRRDGDRIVGCNPCAEIQLRSNQLCNLTEVVARSNDTEEGLLRKVRVAAILGTLQASLTDFKYVRKVWQNNCEDEALLGVSLTGIQDCHLLQDPDPMFLSELRQEAIDANTHYANILGIKPATAITTIKPSGTVSQLVDSASGIHGRFAPYYIRAVRQANNDPLTTFLKDAGVPNEVDAMNPAKTTVFYFPIKSPKKAVLASEQSAIQQLENWLMYQKYWSEHSVSVTVYVKEHEWMAVGAWCYENFDSLTGVSFLPYSDHTYAQAPYTPCTEQEYIKAVKAMPDVDFSLLQNYEEGDTTEGAQTLACTAGGCEL
jgi:ribonucleoside-triphosphate reductase (thioredoxin)